MGMNQFRRKVALLLVAMLLLSITAVQLTRAVTVEHGESWTGIWM